MNLFVLFSWVVCELRADGQKTDTRDRFLELSVPRCFSFSYGSCFLFLAAHSHSRKDRERRPQVVRRSAPDSGVLIRLKAQMAEVRSKMSDVKGQAMEARGPGEPRPGPSGGFSVEEVPSHHADSELSASRKPGELDLLGRAAAARSRPCRPGEHCCTANANNAQLLYSCTVPVFLKERELFTCVLTSPRPEIISTFASVFSGFSQEIAVACPGQQQLSGREEEESRGDGEGPERSRRYERAQPASQRGSGRSRGSVSDTHVLTTNVPVTQHIIHLPHHWVSGSSAVISCSLCPHQSRRTVVWLHRGVAISSSTAKIQIWIKAA